MVPFAGWEMPVQYGGVREEVLAVRQNCGLFDVSHMGQLDVHGPGVTQALNAIVSSDWSRVEPGRAAYALLLNERGGVQDDVMGYRLEEDRWLVVVNASRAQEDEKYLRALLPPEISLSNRYASQAMIAIQGPRAEAILQAWCGTDLSELHLRDVRESHVLDKPAVITRGGYTGSDGFEWMGSAELAPGLWRKLTEAGAAPCGLGARDVLRLEAGLPLYGHELRAEWTPQESGVAWAVRMEKPDFQGKAALENRHPHANALRGLRMLGRGIAREGYVVARGGEAIGVVTSGSPSPTLEANIALAILPRGIEAESEVDVLIRGVAHPARVSPLPFVPRSTKAAPKATPQIHKAAPTP